MPSLMPSRNPITWAAFLLCMASVDLWRMGANNQHACCPPFLKAILRFGDPGQSIKSPRENNNVMNETNSNNMLLIDTTSNIIMNNPSPPAILIRESIIMGQQNGKNLMHQQPSVMLDNSFSSMNSTTTVTGVASSRQSQSTSNTSRQTSYFQYLTTKTAFQDVKPIPFDPEWKNDFRVSIDELPPPTYPVDTPTHLPLPDWIEVYDTTKIKKHDMPSLKQLAREARQLIDQQLPKSNGAMLFRNLHQHIHNASDFSQFWSHILSDESKKSNSNWQRMDDHLSCYNRQRQRLAGTDQVDTDVPQVTIGPHNEHACNPWPSHKIFFYVIHPAAVGGESLLRRNQDITVPKQAWDILHHTGGLHFERSYPSQLRLNQIDPDKRHPTEMSWQQRCHANTTEEARQYFSRQHGIANTTFHADDNTLYAHNILKGYLTATESRNNDNHHHSDNDLDKLWYNRIDYGFPVQMADGSQFPLDLQSYLKQQKWHETFAVKLQQGDWLVLDNLRVQHGRLPYLDMPGMPKRQLLVTYTASSVSLDAATATQ